jgi:hypothetical protein
MEKPIVCNLTSPELQERKATVIAALKARLLSKETLGHGVRLKFQSTDDMLDKLIEFIKTERLCCNFLLFELKVEENFAWLALTGPHGTKDFLEKELGF